MTRTFVTSALARRAVSPHLRIPLAIVAACSALATLILGIRYAGTSEASPLDDALHTVAAAVSDSIPFALVIDAGGEPVGAITLIAIVAATCLVAGRWRLAVLTVAAQGLIGSTTNLVKPLFDRTIHGGFLSYPSGHTAGATAFAIVIGLLVVDVTSAGRRVGITVVLAAVAAVGAVAAWAQTVLVAHYPTDTVGGLTIGIALVPLAGFVIDAGADRLMAAQNRSRP